MVAYGVSPVNAAKWWKLIILCSFLGHGSLNTTSLVFELLIIILLSQAHCITCLNFSILSTCILSSRTAKLARACALYNRTMQLISITYRPSLLHHEQSPKWMTASVLTVNIQQIGSVLTWIFEQLIDGRDLLLSTSLWLNHFSSTPDRWRYLLRFVFFQRNEQFLFSFIH